jgi:hypothetical protein
MRTFRVFDLSGVRGDEKDAMLKALNKAQVDYYLTPDMERGSPGIFVRSEEEALKATKAIDSAQRDWFYAARGKAKTEVNPETKYRDIRIWILFIVIAIVLFIGLINPGSGW